MVDGAIEWRPRGKHERIEAELLVDMSQLQSELGATIDSTVPPICHSKAEPQG
jgi:hypothetical protein